MKSAYKKLPPEVEGFLKDKKIDRQDLLYTAETDLDSEGRFADGYLVLTRNLLGVIQAPVTEGKVHFFRGSDITKGGKVLTDVEEEQSFEDLDYGDRQEWKAEFIPLDVLERLWIENCVGCNLLVGKWEEQEHCLLMFTHLQKRVVAKLVRAVEQMKRGEEPDFAQEGEEYCPKCGRMYPDRERKVCPNCMDKRNVLFRVFGYFKPYKLQFVFMMVAVICTSLLNLVWPYLNGDILYDKVLAKDTTFLDSLGLQQDSFVTVLLFLVLAMAGTKLIMLVFSILQGVLTAQMVVGVVRDLKKSVFRKMGLLSISFYRSRQTGSLMTRGLSDAERITGFFVD